MGLPAVLTRIYAGAIDRFERLDEREFLPAALEVLETPASPVSRIFGLVIVLFFACALAWAFLGKVDIIASAPGRILPAGDVKVIQPVDPGVVRAIHVQDGDHVRAGQLLLELDPTQAGADRDRLSSDLAQARLDVARLTALSRGEADFGAAPADAPPERVAEARAALRAQAGQQAARLADLTQQIAQKSAEAAEISAETDKVNATLPMLAEKERIHRELTARGYGTSLAYLDAQQQLAASRHDLGIQAQRRAEVIAARTALERERDALKAQYAADTLTELRRAEEQQNQLSQDLVKAQAKSEETQLRAPIDGVVEQLAVHTLHGVVMPAQRLMIVVPDSRDLVIEAQLANRDVGFVRKGQPVKVKIEAFNYTRYGLVEGRVVDVSRDAVNPGERPGAGSAPPTDSSRLGSSPAYVARIALAKTSMQIDGTTEPLRPGMAITAEIKTGKRSILDYLISPIARTTEESLHER